MDQIAEAILALLNASPADYVIVTMGGVVALCVACLYQKLKGIEKKYQILNTNHLALWVMVAPDAVKWHHTGEYHIDIKALADIAKARNGQIPPK
jgi:hypothetical protein